MTSPVQQDLLALLNEKEAARFLSVSHRTLQAWRASRAGPPFIQMGRAIRYCRDDLIGWMKSRRTAV